MAKAFRRLQKQVQDRRSYQRPANLGVRVRKLEEAFFELSTIILNSMLEQDAGNPDPDPVVASFAEAHEDFKKHLEEVLKEDKRG